MLKVEEEPKRPIICILLRCVTTDEPKEIFGEKHYAQSYRRRSLIFVKTLKMQLMDMKQVEVLQ